MIFIRRNLLYFVVFLCGMNVMSFEIIGARILGPYVGTSIFVWSSIIGIILASLSAGYWFGGKISDHNPNYKKLSYIILVAGIGVLIASVAKSFVLNLLLDLISNI